MKKRAKSKIKKLLPKIGMWSLWAGIAALCAYASIHSFVSLHDGAPIRDVGGRKYAPVLNELLLMMGAAIFLLFLLKITTKLKTAYLVAIGIVLFGCIGWFGYWAFGYTHQNPTEGFLTLLIIVGAVSLVTAIALWREWYVRRRSKR